MSIQVRTTEQHLVVELASAAGRKYEIGYPIDAGYTEHEVVEHANALAAGLSEAFLPVNWVPGASPVTPSKQVQNLGIAEGYVSYDRGTIYNYRINFKNTKGWSFDFEDATKMKYSCSTIYNGWHYIDFNSDDATIVGVS
ncbi:hypothetical protein [Pseudomonas sp. TE3610]